jgi:hypothetical protein
VSGLLAALAAEAALGFAEAGAALAVGSLDGQWFLRCGFFCRCLCRLDGWLGCLLRGRLGGRLCLFSSARTLAAGLALAFARRPAWPWLPLLPGALAVFLTGAGFALALALAFFAAALG